MVLTAKQFADLMPDGTLLESDESEIENLGIHQEKLLYFTSEEEFIFTPKEATLQAQKRAEKLATKLRELGINTDDF